MNKTFLKILASVLLLSTSIVEARQGPPPPTPMDSLPGLPIDSNIILLIVVSLIFGIYKIYLKQKTSI